MIKYRKYRKVTDISLVTDTISIYRKKPISTVPIRYTHADISISAIYRPYFRYSDPPLISTSPRRYPDVFVFVSVTMSQCYMMLRLLRKNTTIVIKISEEIGGNCETVMLAGPCYKQGSEAQDWAATSHLYHRIKAITSVTS